MTLDEYQKQALTTALRVDDEFKNLAHWVLGMTGEAGEVAEKLKKVIRDNNGVLDNESKGTIAKETGDVLWYIAVIADHLGYSLDELATINIEKLSSRKIRGKLHGSGDDR